MLFISYSRKDSEIAEHHAYVWRAAGQNAFLDEHSLQPGEDYKQQIADTIQKADRLMLFWSRSAANSTHVADEWRLALATPTCKIVPVLIDDTPLPNELQHLHGVASFGRMFQHARSRDLYGFVLRQLTQAVLLLLVIAIPAWIFMGVGLGEPPAARFYPTQGEGINSELATTWNEFLFGKKPSFWSGFYAVFQHVLPNVVLPILVFSVIYVYLIKKYHQLHLRREIQRHARDTVTTPATSTQPPNTIDSRGESS